MPTCLFQFLTRLNNVQIPYTNMNAKKRLLFFVTVLFALSSCTSQGETKTQKKDVCLNDKGFEFLQAYYDECNDNYLDSARFFLEKALECNDGNSVAFYNLILVLGAQEEYGEMIDLYQNRLNQIRGNAYLAKAETYSELAMLYGKTGDTISCIKMTQYASNEFEKCFSQNQITVDLMVSFLLFSAYKDGKESAMLELKKYKDVFPNEDYYSAFENQLMEFNPNDCFSSKCN